MLDLSGRIHATALNKEMAKKSIELEAQPRDELMVHANALSLARGSLASILHTLAAAGKDTPALMNLKTMLEGVMYSSIDKEDLATNARRAYIEGVHFSCHGYGSTATRKTAPIDIGTVLDEIHSNLKDKEESHIIVRLLCFFETNVAFKEQVRDVSTFVRDNRVLMICSDRDKGYFTGAAQIINRLRFQVPMAARHRIFTAALAPDSRAGAGAGSAAVVTAVLSRTHAAALPTSPRPVLFYNRLISKGRDLFADQKPFLDACNELQVLQYHSNGKPKSGTQMLLQAIIGFSKRFNTAQCVFIADELMQMKRVLTPGHKALCDECLASLLPDAPDPEASGPLKRVRVR
jgi:hypothetical protein